MKYVRELVKEELKGADDFCVSEQIVWSSEFIAYLMFKCNDKMIRQSCELTRIARSVIFFFISY